MKRFRTAAGCVALVISLCACGTPQEPEIFFHRGVWAASVDGRVDTYFVFIDDANGRVERADGSSLSGFTCEQSGNDAEFFFATTNNYVHAVMDPDDNTGTFDYGDRTVIYTFECLPEEDPDAFAASVGEVDTLFYRGV